MELKKKKILAAKTLGVGKNRLAFNLERLAEIKEAITRQDIRDLFASGTIYIKELNGRRKIEKRKTRRRSGSIRKSSKKGKREYILLTRKLRSFIAELRRQDKLSRENYYSLRKEIKASRFKSKAHLKERVSQLT